MSRGGAHDRGRCHAFFFSAPEHADPSQSYFPLPRQCVRACRQKRRQFARRRDRGENGRMQRNANGDLLHTDTAQRRRRDSALVRVAPEQSKGNGPQPVQAKKRTGNGSVSADQVRPLLGELVGAHAAARTDVARCCARCAQGELGLDLVQVLRPRRLLRGRDRRPSCEGRCSGEAARTVARAA
jgi:hypothetical protein